MMSDASNEIEWLLQGWGAGAGLAPWSQSHLRKKQEPEPLGKKSGAAKKLAGSSALREDEHKEIVLLVKIVSFYDKKAIILLVLYFFAVLPNYFAGKRIFWKT